MELSGNGPAGAAAALPELASVPWRPRASERSLTRTGRLWTLTAVAHTIPFLAAAGLLFSISPITAPIGLIVLAHAWIIPELYAAVGRTWSARVHPRGTGPSAGRCCCWAT